MSDSGAGADASASAEMALAPLQRRLHDVATYQLPRLRGCASVALARDLAAEARGDLETVRRGLEDAREDAESRPLRERADAVAAVAVVEDEYAQTHSAYRAAVVAAKKASAAGARKHELLEPVEDVPRSESSAVVGGDDALQTKTNEVTDALRRTTQLLQTELERSVLSTQMLDESTRTLRTTHGLYDNYEALLTASGQLVRALERADWWDRALIAAAFSCFLLVVLWIIKQRVLDRVGGAAVWWVGGSYKLLRLGFGGGKAGAIKDAADRAESGHAEAIQNLDTQLPQAGVDSAVSAKVEDDDKKVAGQIAGEGAVVSAKADDDGEKGAGMIAVERAKIFDGEAPHEPKAKAPSERDAEVPVPVEDVRVEEPAKKRPAAEKPPAKKPPAKATKPRAEGSTKDEL